MVLPCLAGLSVAAGALAFGELRRRKRRAQAPERRPPAKAKTSRLSRVVSTKRVVSDGSVHAATPLANFLDRQLSFYTAISGSNIDVSINDLDSLFPNADLRLPTASQEELDKAAELRDRLRADDLGAWASRWLEDFELIRYLRSRGGCAEAAEALLRTALEWRSEHAAEWEVDISFSGSFGALHARYLEETGASEFGDLLHELSSREAASGGSSGRSREPPDWWTFLREHLHMDVYGTDEHGVPVAYNDVGSCDFTGCVREVGLDKVLRYCVYLNDFFFDAARLASQKRSKEKGGQALLHGGIVIVDMERMGLRHTSEIKFFQEIADAAKLLHPERQRRGFIVRAPRMFSMLWKMVSPRLDPRAKEKIAILSAGEALEPLVAELGLDMVPTCLGGEYRGLMQRSKDRVPEGAFERHRLAASRRRGLRAAAKSL